MDVWRKVELPVDFLVLEKYVCNRKEVVVAGDDDKLDVRVRRRPFAEAFVDPLLLVVDVPYAATAQRYDVTGKNNNIRALGIESLKVAVQV